jgi:glucosamine--fructose-6-phosphate aminotransferase (isomerizing)
MCGIIGYLGPGDGISLSLKGLERLEYRGYDSAGLAAWQKGKIVCQKTKGQVKILRQKILSRPENKSHLVIAHNRWATHGEPSKINAHPQSDCSRKIFLVHNGVIENYQSLKKWLKKRGHSFFSQTDTEVIAHLIEENYQGNLLKAIQKTLPLLTGAYGLAVISESEPQRLVVAKKGSPLVIGICKKGEYIVASDPVAIIEHTRKIIYLDDGEIGVLSPQGARITNFSNSPIKKEVQSIEWDLAKIEKEGFPHFMLKEIFKQPETIKNALRGRINKKQGQIKLGGLEDWLGFIANCPRAVFLACGTSWHAGLIAKYYFENLVGLPANAEYASEFRYSQQPIDPRVAYFAISQSGETADTLASLRKIKKQGGPVFGLINVVGSTIAREANAGVYIHAGPEIGVASTKAFTSQVTLLAILALALVQEKKLWPLSEIKKSLKALEQIPQQVEEVLKNAKKIESLAKKYAQFQNALYLGREYNFPVALEGALKLKEISYVHAEGYPAAEIKHGPIALIDQNMPTFVVATNPDDLVYQKVITNIEEIKARGGNILAVANSGDEIIENLANQVILVPQTLDFLSPIINIIPWQLWSYYVAVQRGCDVDKPRNLAKSVTVE